MYQRILVATDGSELASKGVEQGFALATALHSDVLVITVSEPWMPSFGDALAWNTGASVLADYNKTNEEAARKILDAVMEKAKAAGVSCRTRHIPNRHPAEAIIETAEEDNSELIIMASHGRRGLGKLLIGSQTNAVLPHSRIPVLVVR